MAATHPATAGLTQSHKAHKGFFMITNYYNEPRDILFFVFFVASCDYMSRIIQSYKTIFLFFGQKTRQ